MGSNCDYAESVPLQLPPAADVSLHRLSSESCHNRLCRRSKAALYSITSSAVASSVGGTVRPSIRAVWF